MGHTYYVGVNGTPSAAGTVADPMSIAHALSIVQPEDTVYFAAETRIDAASSSSAAQPVSYVRLDGPRALAAMQDTPAEPVPPRHRLADQDGDELPNRQTSDTTPRGLSRVEALLGTDAATVVPSPDIPDTDSSVSTLETQVSSQTATPAPAGSGFGFVDLVAKAESGLASRGWHGTP